MYMITSVGDQRIKTQSLTVSTFVLIYCSIELMSGLNLKTPDVAMLFTDVTQRILPYTQCVLCPAFQLLKDDVMYYVSPYKVNRLRIVHGGTRVKRYRELFVKGQYCCRFSLNNIIPFCTVYHTCV